MNIKAIEKRARQRQRIALRIKELRGLNRKKHKGINIFDGINYLRGLSKNYPKL